MRGGVGSILKSHVFFLERIPGVDYILETNLLFQNLVLSRHYEQYLELENTPSCFLKLVLLFEFNIKHCIYILYPMFGGGSFNRNMILLNTAVCP